MVNPMEVGAEERTLSLWVDGVAEVAEQSFAAEMEVVVVVLDVIVNLISDGEFSWEPQVVAR